MAGCIPAQLERAMAMAVSAAAISRSGTLKNPMAEVPPVSLAPASSDEPDAALSPPYSAGPHADMVITPR